LIPWPVDNPGDPAELTHLLDAFDWIVALDNESRTHYLDRGRRYVIRGTANSKIMASFLQHRSEAKSTSDQISKT
jgi:hypothetical protein